MLSNYKNSLVRLLSSALPTRRENPLPLVWRDVSVVASKQYGGLIWSATQAGPKYHLVCSVCACRCLRSRSWHVERCYCAAHASPPPISLTCRGISFFPPLFFLLFHSLLTRFEQRRHPFLARTDRQLSCSDIEPLHLSELLDRASPSELESWEQLSLAYPADSRGDEPLRSEIAAFYNESGNENGAIGSVAPSAAAMVTPDDVTVTVPAEGILLAVLAMVRARAHAHAHSLPPPDSLRLSALRTSSLTHSLPFLSISCSCFLSNR